jgi:elongation factor P--beta-lysine ligase
MLRPTIEQTITDLEWISFVNTLRGTHHHKSFTKAKYFQVSIRKDKFWDTCANFVQMVKLILFTSKTFNGKQFIMGKAWFVMKTLE